MTYVLTIIGTGLGGKKAMTFLVRIEERLDDPQRALLDL